MKGGFKENLLLFLVLVSLTLLLSGSALAADVAYIYKKNSRIDKNILDTFSEMSLTVDLINEKNLPSSLSNYKFVFLGDENFRRLNKIQIGTVPTIIMNHYNGNALGLTDRDGISQLASRDYLAVISSGEEVNIYKSITGRRRVSLPVYFLAEENKLPSSTTIASTNSYSRNRIGDVISYILPGSVLENGKTTTQEICFFGIIKTHYWTEDSKDMFRKCVDFVSGNQACTGEDCFVCSSNSDCGIDGFIGNNFCSDNNVVRSYRTFTCNNPETSQSSCSSSQENQVVETCSSGCSSGVCTSEQSNLIHDIGFVNVTNTVGIIRVRTTDNVDVPAETPLQCNQKYQIKVKIKNKGNFTENISLSGSIGSVPIIYSNLNLESGMTSSERTNTVNITLEQGSYNLIINAAMVGFPDANPLDNIAEKQVSVLCSD